MFRKVNKVHFVGIGGIGMSGIAELLLNLGFSISGSDLNDSEIIRNLRSKGAMIFEGHHAKNLGDCEVLVYSSAVPEDNPELIAAREKKVPIIKRAEMLGELIALKQTSIGVGGTHGKTSTSSMIGALLSHAQLDPTLVVGGLVKNIDTNSQLGSGDLIVVEADEYDKSFLQLKPTISVITNIEQEHMDCYDDLEDLHNSFAQFANAVPFYGVVLACLDSSGVQDIIPKIKRPVITYGLTSQADISAKNIQSKESKTTYSLYKQNQKCGKVTLNVPGKHNVLNSLAAAAIGFEMGLDAKTIIDGIGSYGGVRRRFEIKGIAGDVMVVDDYAHHPTEVSATLQAARGGWDRRIIAVFQPHLFSRTKSFYKEFAAAFMDSDVLIVTDIYPAREKPIKGITGKLVFNAARSTGHKNAHYIPDLKDLQTTLDGIIQENDMVITIGAGTIWRYAQSYFDHLISQEAAA
ncbi:MAG TPA: UDP-N-acetylmuramate--L-alanine ligase [Candidatus Marinimicrobia bacterium]|mgnify:FL=1|jgi:UDP-N-acetylmuramate--alanine ligase|nr:UDP-N-acetylmuramate--L-alanine ligase [Candidatus Neomarinimicrobiota bacterium]HIB33916.1 UDP-N-acetylmuramate--L-alanine ligase [Candidatus Neomarinimicrobiota bacterium]|tara:strand:+ start:762 stop:2150 length:1389 start_codon:yes stop_codon:yes gene_type:complete